MKKSVYHIRLLIAVVAGCFFTTVTNAQTEQEKVTALIFHKDSLFWNAYNNCDTATFRSFITDDVEFYHDKGGITLGADKLTLSIKNNLCSNKDFHLRREAVAGTVKVFTLQDANVIYGAIISGEHYFYITEGNKKEFRDGWAKFTQLWILKNGVWKMSRILSYDHAPAPYINARKEINLSAAAVKQFAGQYTGTGSGTITIKAEKNRLLLVGKSKTDVLYAESANRFFAKERDLVFEFVKTTNKNYVLKVIERGELVEELK